MSWKDLVHARQVLAPRFSVEAANGPLAIDASGLIHVSHSSSGSLPISQRTLLSPPSWGK